MGFQPKWISKGNKVSFIYNGSWACCGTIDSYIEELYTKINMSNVTINGKYVGNYQFLLPSLKNPSIIQ